MSFHPTQFTQPPKQLASYWSYFYLKSIVLKRGLGQILSPLFNLISQLTMKTFKPRHKELTIKHKPCMLKRTKMQCLSKIKRKECQSGFNCSQILLLTSLQQSWTHLLARYFEIFGNSLTIEYCP